MELSYFTSDFYWYERQGYERAGETAISHFE